MLATTGEAAWEGFVIVHLVRSGFQNDWAIDLEQKGKEGVLSHMLAGCTREIYLDGEGRTGRGPLFC